MKNISEGLWNLQAKLLQRAGGSEVKEAAIRELRNEISESTLARFDQILSRGKRAVAAVRRGVCGECHIQVPKAQLIALAIEGGTHLCGSCGRYLYLSPEESINVLKAPPKKEGPPVRRKKLLAHAP